MTRTLSDIGCCVLRNLKLLLCNDEGVERHRRVLTGDWNKTNTSALRLGGDLLSHKDLLTVIQDMISLREKVKKESPPARQVTVLSCSVDDNG